MIIDDKLIELIKKFDGTLGFFRKIILQKIRDGSKE